MKTDYSKNELVDTDRVLTVDKKKSKLYNKLILQLVVSIAIIAVAAAVRINFPEFYSGVTSSFSNSVDFVSAFNAIGVGISGEKNMTEALKEAYQFAFIGDEGDSFQVSAVE